uniref:endoribonuclease Dicer homolog 3-like n=1 Tax=Erigeron canadensis TaxID=72917 RepID=UPI001CB8CF1A|nr:endoribonuclease Dicer homolog 3-like [Erigeron canadensis]
MVAASLDRQGSEKKKELHGITPIRAISGSWGDRINDCVDFYGYKVSFTCDIVDVKFSSLVLLVESKLDEDVEDVQMNLYIGSNVVKCKVFSYVKLHLNAHQVAKAKGFHELCFNGIFGELYTGSKEPREFLLQSNRKLWNPNCMYLLLPLEFLEPLRISWKEIGSCVSVVDFVKKNSIFQAERDNVDSIMMNSDHGDMIHFANKSIHKDNVNEVVVLAIHTGKMYIVLKFIEDETADSPYDRDQSRFSSFTDYFKKEYEIVLKYPRQHLLLLKQSDKTHNPLVDFSRQGIHMKKYHPHIPPELLVIIDVRIDVVKSIYLLPSLMHRLESLMLASQLREEITGHAIDLHIPSSLILEAITTYRCNESFSMERLELLGDAVIKYVISCDLYLKYVKDHEGNLSSRRSLQVCNSNLYNLGIGRQLQGYVRDTAFDPTQWAAPGQLPFRRHPCDHGIETTEVPIDIKYQTEDPKIIIGRCCDRGHRWLSSKTVSDCVEGLVAAYYVGKGLIGALHCMKWLGVCCDLDPSRINEAIEIAALHSYTPKLDIIHSVESKLEYEFEAKGLLLEAITHASDRDQGTTYCYQRLEFLGDSVIDLLITSHLYEKHRDITPGEMTDLRSASVNNENFASAAVRRKLHLHLQYRSSYLQSQIAEYVVASSSTDTNSLQTKKCPKALGDLLESIAGAILVDTKFNLDKVWRIIEPLLSPIVTPDKLELPPSRELRELCDSMGYYIDYSCSSKGDTTMVELRLQLQNAFLSAQGCGPTRKFARGLAAIRLLKELEKREISQKNLGLDNRDGEINNQSSNISDTTPEEPNLVKNLKLNLVDRQPEDTPLVEKCLLEKESNSKVEFQAAVLKSIDTKKGGPRSSLNELCMKMQWQAPIFTPLEQKSKNQTDIGEVLEKRTAFNGFQSHITLTIPNYGAIELTGDPRADKKSSFDSAALLMLYELQRLGMLKIG